jgi:hypothetical protein
LKSNPVLRTGPGRERDGDVLGVEECKKGDGRKEEMEGERRRESQGVLRHAFTYEPVKMRECKHAIRCCPRSHAFAWTEFFELARVEIRFDRSKNWRERLFFIFHGSLRYVNQKA